VGPWAAPCGSGKAGGQYLAGRGGIRKNSLKKLIEGETADAAAFGLAGPNPGLAPASYEDRKRRGYDECVLSEEG